MKRGDKVALVVFAVFMGFVISLFANSSLACLQVKDDYENNPELAREKYKYDSFEDWRLNGATLDYASTCFPDIDIYIP